VRWGLGTTPSGPSAPESDRTEIEAWTAPIGPCGSITAVANACASLWIVSEGLLEADLGQLERFRQGGSLHVSAVVGDRKVYRSISGVGEVVMAAPSMWSRTYSAFSKVRMTFRGRRAGTRGLTPRQTVTATRAAIGRPT